MLFLFVQASLLIVAKPFYACFCTSCVPRQPKCEISSVRWRRSWYALVRCGTRWNRFGELKRELKWLVTLTFRRNASGRGYFYRTLNLYCLLFSQVCKPCIQGESKEKESTRVSTKIWWGSKTSFRKGVLNTNRSVCIFRCRENFNLSLHQVWQNHGC